MDSKRILIVEDEPIIATDIEMTLEDLGYEVIGIEDNAIDALKLIEKQRPDLVLLDINLEGDADGVMLAQDINEQFKIPFVYLTSNADNLTINRVKRTKPAGFILKPFNEKDLKSNIEIALFSKVTDEIAESNAGLPSLSGGNPTRQELKEFFVKDGSSLVKIKASDLLFIKADDNYSRIYTKQKSYILTTSLKAIEDRLSPTLFIRTHRSYVVNIEFIDKVKDTTLYIDNHSLPIGRRYKEVLFNRINKL